MSSVAVRDIITDFVKANVAEKVIDLSGQFENLDDMIQEAGLTPNDSWVGIEFTGNDEQPITIGTRNSEGKWREHGVIAVHVVGLAGLGNARPVLLRADALRFKMRGQRLGRLVIESVAPANTDSGSSINLEQGYFSAAFLAEYSFESDVTP